MQHLTVKDYAKRKGVSEKTVYSWIKKDMVNYTVETVQGRSITYVLIPLVQKEVNRVNEVNEASDTCNEQNKSSQRKEVETQSNAFADSELLGKVIDDNHKMREELLTLTKDYMSVAQMAGQAKLLMDSEHKTKEEYFKVIQENAQLKAKLEQLQEKMNQQEEEKKQQGFLSFFSKL